MIAANNPPEDDRSESASDGGRDPSGKFAPGNKISKGNPYAKQAAAWRHAFATSITADDMKAAVRKLVRWAKKGEAWAVRELLDRTLGKPHQSIGISEEPDDDCPEGELLRDELRAILQSRARQLTDSQNGSV